MYYRFGSSDWIANIKHVSLDVGNVTVVANYSVRVDRVVRVC